MQNSTAADRMVIPSFDGSINICDVSLTPTDLCGNSFSDSQERLSQQKKVPIKRKPIHHPTWHSKSPGEYSNSGEMCENCGTGIAQRGQASEDPSPVPVATLLRHKYYSKLTDPHDERLRMPDHILPSSLFYIIPAEPERQSSLVTIFAIWNTMMGTSLLSMPWGLSQSGFTLGIILISLTGLLTMYTALIVVRSKNYLSCQVFEFSDISRYYFGKVGEWSAIIFGLLAFVGGMMVYWVLMSNFLYMTGVFIHDKITEKNITYSANMTTNITDVVCFNAPPISPNESGWKVLGIYSPSEPETTFDKFWNVKNTTPLYLIVLVFPLLNFKSATFFTKFNCLGTISVFYLCILLIIKAAMWGFHMDYTLTPSAGFDLPQFRLTFPALTGMLSLAYFLHNAVITILRNNEKQENNVRDMSVGYFLVMITYLFVGTIFYSSFPLPKHCIASNLLDNLTSNDPLAVGARVLLLFQMLTVFPLLAYISRIQILHSVLGNVWPGRLHVVALNVLLVTVCVLVAMFYPHIGDIIRYSGSLCGLVYVFLLPSLVYLVAMYRRAELSTLSGIFHISIILFGFANFIAQFVISPSK